MKAKSAHGAPEQAIVTPNSQEVPTVDEIAERHRAE
jgi:hypothetical protein